MEKSVFLSEWMSHVLFCISFEKYILMRISTFYQIYISSSPPLKNGVFGLDFLALAQKEAR